MAERLSSLEEELTRLRDEHIRLSHQLEALTGAADSALAAAERAHSRIDDFKPSDSAVDADLRKRFYTLVGKLREVKDTSTAWGHSHSIRVFEGEL